MDDYLYSKDHEWIRCENNLATVGVSDFAQEELGEIAFVELPAIGTLVESGEAVCSIDSLKSTSEIYAPVSGKIVRINERLSTDEKACGLINTDPLGEGWLFVVEMSDPGQREQLLSAEEYRRYLETG